TPALARALADRHRGVGFDQLAVLTAADRPGADVRVTYWNADGSTSAACGNATRCIARLLLDEGRGPELAIDVAGRGVLTAGLRADGIVSVDMGKPALAWEAIPLAEPVDTLSLPLARAPVAVNMGNPHAVHFVEDLDAVDWRAEGAVVEHHALFPERTNVQFVQVLSRRVVRAAVWERGVGPSLASGSSACAIAVAGHLRGLTDRVVSVMLPGGTLEIEWRADDHVLMAGPVADVFEGRLTPAFLAGLAGDAAREAAE
ncbi:MAG: diaminopimelate epimerase, partial [Pseudomonadota bacterium]